MVYFGKPNCEHYDNYGRCRIHRGDFLTRWLSPPGKGDGRPRCIIDRNWNSDPQDGELTCPDQKERPRPPPPSGVQRPAPPAPPPIRTIREEVWPSLKTSDHQNAPTDDATGQRSELSHAPP